MLLWKNPSSQEDTQKVTIQKKNFSAKQNEILMSIYILILNTISMDFLS